MRVLFLGSRTGVLDAIRHMPEVEPVAFFVVRDSEAHRYASAHGLPHVAFSRHERETVLRGVEGTDFELLVSNGCPIVLPVSRLARPHQRFVNIHRSLLPDLRGPHPVNGALLWGRRETGVTMHYMDDGIDTGDIIAQESVEITDDLDLGLLYRLLFDLEPGVFRLGMRRLLDSPRWYTGRPQGRDGSCYRRDAADMAVRWDAMGDAEILRRVRAFGLRSQGVSCSLGDAPGRVFAAQAVRNSGALRRWSSEPPGTVLAAYDGTLLVRSRDGIIRVTDYVTEDRPHGFGDADRMCP